MRQQEAEFLKSMDLPIYVYGGGEVANFVKKNLSENGIAIQAYVVDKKDSLDEAVISKDELLSNPVNHKKGYILVRGFLGAFYKTDEEIMEQWAGCKAVMSVADMYEPDFAEPMSHDFYLNNRHLFDCVYENLADELSRKSFDAYIDAKISKTNTKLLSVVEPVQYFFKNALWKYEPDDVLIDGGAFTGDSIRDFIQLRGDQYKKIIAFEPDSDNYNKLLEYQHINSLSKIETWNIGLSDAKKRLKFVSDGTMMSGVSENGNVYLDVDTIDHIVGQNKATIIKMDIEGSEMEALLGAEQTITRCRPILMISAYHKKDDVYKIFDFINTRVPHYKYFFRCHKPLAIDAVLYAVPEERIC